jgi:dipeptidyl aminopeptidase/acylaminoacyl peptidase
VATTRRAPTPQDLYRMAIPTDARLSPDGSMVAFTVQRVGPAYDRYGTSIWIAPAGRTAGAAADRADGVRQVTIGVRRDSRARWSPDGRWLAFISDRRALVEEEPGAPKEREDLSQVHLLPADGPGEARRLTDLPRGVDAAEWSPDGRWLAVISASRGATHEADARARRKPAESKPGTPPHSDFRFAERLHFLQNGSGFVADRVPQVWLVDVVTGAARRLTDLPAGAWSVAWSPDSTRLAIATGGARDHDLRFRPRVVAIEVESGRTWSVAEHPEGSFTAPAWLPDGARVVVLGGRLPHAAYRSNVIVFPADGSDARGGRDLTGRHDLMPGSSMASDLAIGEEARLLPEADGRSVLALAPYRGATDIWRVDVDDASIERLTDGRHHLSGFDAIATPGGTRIAAIRSTAASLPVVVVADLDPADKRDRTVGQRHVVELRPVADCNEELSAELDLREPVERWVEVDGRQVQGWLIPAGEGPRPTVLEIHGGPHTLYGCAPFLEFQVLAASGISVAYGNPRGSEGYGREFNEANRSDWGDGPMRDVLAIVDAFVADGLADPDRLGVTGGSYGGYLTSWIVGHDQRFKAAMTCRSVADMEHLLLAGDLGGTEWPKQEFGAWTWEDPERFRLASPLTYATEIRTPLLIQHSERDLRTTIDQGDMLFSLLRRLRRPVRMMRVPNESHELTRSGTPFRRAENLVQVRDWFAHFLVRGRRGLPPPPRTRYGR